MSVCLNDIYLFKSASHNYIYIVSYWIISCCMRPQTLVAVCIMHHMACKFFGHYEVHIFLYFLLPKKDGCKPIRVSYQVNSCRHTYLVWCYLAWPPSTHTSRLSMVIHAETGYSCGHSNPWMTIHCPIEDRPGQSGQGNKTSRVHETLL